MITLQKEPDCKICEFIEYKGFGKKRHVFAQVYPWKIVLLLEDGMTLYKEIVMDHILTLSGCDELQVFEFKVFKNLVGNFKMYRFRSMESISKLHDTLTKLHREKVCQTINDLQVSGEYTENSMFFPSIVQITSERLYVIICNKKKSKSSTPLAVWIPIESIISLKKMEHKDGKEILRLQVFKHSLKTNMYFKIAHQRDEKSLTSNLSKTLNRIISTKTHDFFKNIRKGNIHQVVAALNGDNSKYFRSQSGGLNALGVAVSSGRYGMINAILLEHPHAKKYIEETLIHGSPAICHSVVMEKREIVELLLEFNANPMAKDSQGVNACQLAMRQKDKVILGVLRKYIEEASHNDLLHNTMKETENNGDLSAAKKVSFLQRRTFDEFE